MAEAFEDPALDDLHGDFDFRSIARSCQPGGQDHGAVVLGGYGCREREALHHECHGSLQDVSRGTFSYMTAFGSDSARPTTFEVFFAAAEAALVADLETLYAPPYSLR